MSVSKMLIASTILLVSALLIGGLYYDSHPIMWFAASTMEYHVVRGVMVLLLIGLFVSRPPRSKVFRSLLGLSAVMLLAVPAYGVALYQVGLVDAIVFTEVAIILAIEALEYRKKPVHAKHIAIREIA